MKTRYILVFCILVYIMALWLAILGYGVVANVLAFSIALIAITPAIIGARHLATRLPKNEAYIMRWRNILVLWLVGALVCHAAGVFVFSPDLAPVYATVPALFLFIICAVLLGNEAQNM